MDVLEVFYDAALVTLPAVLYRIMSTIVCAVFWSNNFETVLNAPVTDFLWSQKVFVHTHCFGFFHMFYKG